MLRKRIASAALAVVMCFSMLPTAAFAESSKNNTPEVTIQNSANEQDSAGGEEAAIVEETSSVAAPAPTEQATPEEAAHEEPEASTAAEKCVAYEHKSDANGVCTICGTDLIAEFNAFYDAAMNGSLIADMNRYGWYEQTGDEQYADAEAAAMESYGILQNALEVFTCFELSVDTDIVLALKEKEQALHELASTAEAAYAYPQDPATFGNGKSEEEQGDELLFDDLPDAPTGSYMGSYGLPVATGETKISISAWNRDLYADTAYMDADALNADDLTMTVTCEDGEDYAVVPIMVQVEYPENGSCSFVTLPDDVELLSYDGSEILTGTDRDAVLTATHAESSASVRGFFAKADSDFTTKFTYVDTNGDTISKTLNVVIGSESDTALQSLQVRTNAVAAAADRPTPSVTSGKITKIEYVVDTWLIWFNGQEAYCCSHGLNGQPNRTLWYAKGDVVATVKTGSGQTDEVTFAPARTTATYDFLSVIHDGTVGEVSVTLPLGSYHVEETTPPYGFISTSESYDVTFAWNEQTQDVVMASKISHADTDGNTTIKNFEIADADKASSDLKEAQTLVFYNEREKAHVGVYKIDVETGKYLAGAIFNLYTKDDIYSADGKLLLAAVSLIATSPVTVEDGYTYFAADIPIQGEQYGTSTAKTAATNSGRYYVQEVQAPAGYYLNTAPLEVTFTYDGQAVQVLDSTCSNKPTEMWVSKRDLTNDEELPGATLTITDSEGNTVREWVSTDTPERITGLHMDEVYTLTETRPVDGYALADSITFKLVQSKDADGNLLDECDVYYLDQTKILFWTLDDWKLLDDATVIMRDDITRVKISKQDITTKEELPGAELVITDKDGNEIARWISTDEPHYIEKLPAGEYTLTEHTAPDGYDIAESIIFTVQPTGEIQTVTMYDAKKPDKPSSTPAPTPNQPTPTPEVPVPTATLSAKGIPQTGDDFPFATLAVFVFGSIIGIAFAVYRHRKDAAGSSEEALDDNSPEDTD